MVERSTSKKSETDVLLSKLRGTSNKKAAEALEELFKKLKSLPQETDTRPFTPLFNIVVSSSILGSKDQKVRLLACCCIAESLRLCAPNTPYSNQQIIDAFSLIIDSFSYLKNPDKEFLYQSAFYTLRSLAEVRSCCILVDLQNESLDLIVSLFQTFYNIVDDTSNSEVFFPSFSADLFASSRF